MKYFVGLLTALLLVTSSCQKHEIQDKARDMVDVNGLTVDKTDFINRYRSSKEFSAAKKITAEDVKKFLDQNFVDDLLLVNKALDEGLDKDSTVAEGLERLKVQVMTSMNGALYRKVMAKPAVVTEKDMKALYARSDHGVKIAYIRLSSKHMADSLYNAIKHGADFGEMARKYSLDVQTFQRGGEVPTMLYPGLLGNEIEDVMFNLKAGQVSKPIFSGGWYYLIKVLKTSKMNLKSFDQEKENLRKKVLQAKNNLHRNNYIDSLFIRFHLKINKKMFPAIKQAFVPVDRVGKIDEKKIPHSLWNKPLATYDGGTFSLGQFVSMYNTMNFTSRVPLRYDDEIENHIKTFVVPYLMYQDGLQMGLQDSSDFKLLYKKMRTNALMQEALRKLVYEKVQVTDDEVKNYYEQHKQQWNNQPFEKIKRFVQNRLKTEKAKEYKEQLTQRLKNSYSVVYNDSLIAAVATTLNEMKKSGPVFRAPNFRRK